MLMLTENLTFDRISDLELEAIQNYVIKSCFVIIAEELDYFFCSRERLIGVFVEDIDLSKLCPRLLKERFNKLFYSKKELEAFALRLERIIGREMARVPFQAAFSISSRIDCIIKLEESFSFLSEEIKTLNLSTSTSKAIDTLWKKSSYGIVPKALNKFSCQLKLGDYCLSTVGLSPKDIKAGIRNKLSRKIQGILKQHKIDIANALKKEILSQMIYKEIYNNSTMELTEAKLA